MQGKLWSGMLAVATAIIGLLPEPVAAHPPIRGGITIGGGSTRITIGTGPHYGGGYRGYGPGYGVGPGYGIGYGPAPVVVRPYPVIVQPQPVYVQPQPVYVRPQPVYVEPRSTSQPTIIQQPVHVPTPSISSPTIIQDSVTPAAYGQSPDGGEITLFSPPSNTQEVRYRLNGVSYSMPPGTKQSFKNDRTWTVEFQSGPATTTRYTLSSTRYKFKMTDGGVNLFQTLDTPESSLQQENPPAPVPFNPLPAAPVPGQEGDAGEIIRPRRSSNGV